MFKHVAAVAVFSLCGAVGGTAAHAQTADHSSCAPWKARWADASKGSDLAAIDGVIGKIPALCPNLKAEASAGRASAAKRIEQERAAQAAAATKERAAREAAARAADPCIQARNDWSYAQNGSEATIQSYIGALPAACAMWKSQAQERLNTLASQRVAKEQEAERQRVAAAAAASQAAEQQRIDAERVQRASAGAKAMGIEGGWTHLSKCFDGRPTETYRVDGEYLVNNLLSTHVSLRFRITRWTANELWAAYNEPNSQREYHFVVNGNKLRTSDFEDLGVHNYLRC